VPITIVSWVLALAALAGQQPAASTPGSASLNYDVFKAKIQPILLAKRPGHARCVVCHSSGTSFRLQPLSPGMSAWTEEESRKNFDAVKRVAFPGNPKSRILMHPLAEQAGGDFFHNGGKHWSSQSDPEWQTLRGWIMGESTTASR
jgi:hypothetical protein